MPIDLPLSAPSAEGTSLPPPRPFGEANTLTLPRAKTVTGQSALVAHGPLPVTAGEQQWRAAIVPAPAAFLTITF